MKKYIESPNFSLEIQHLNPNENIFLAGSISNARDWQSDATPKLLDKFNVFNPRRANFDASIAEMENEQILWEFTCINQRCRHILFWFSDETVAPITLFEYGRCLSTHDYSRIYVGCDNSYPRRRDVYIQTKLAEPRIIVHRSLPNVIYAALRNAPH